MPILQNKLVMKSIEALHDEALALTPNSASENGVAVSSPPAIIHATKSPHESPVNALATDGDDIMARIDHLLKKLDEEDDTVITPPPANGPQTYTLDAADHANSTATDHPPIADRPDPTDEAAITSPHESPDSASDDTADNAETDNIKTNNIQTDNIAADHPTETSSADQDQALADIAAAIYQAQQQVVDTVVADANQYPAARFDMDALSATVANEVRRTVSAVMTAELPQMLRDAVSEAIRTLPAETSHQPKPASGKTS
ncbi:MAG: hypothetical protein VXX83_02710, partial [Pseudomonadota bacterium]|nr:hypothetical protein [Pseudomonadota bacterium]